jgi:hypothetical protein
MIQKVERILMQKSLKNFVQYERSKQPEKLPPKTPPKLSHFSLLRHSPHDLSPKPYLKQPKAPKNLKSPKSPELIPKKRKTTTPDYQKTKILFLSQTFFSKETKHPKFDCLFDRFEKYLIDFRPIFPEIR